MTTLQNIRNKGVAAYVMLQLADGEHVRGWLTANGCGVWQLCGDVPVITYSYGLAPPPGGRQAALALACELGNAAAGGRCQLPQRVTSLVRQGVTYDILDDMSWADRGLTGIPRVDEWLRVVNAGGRAQRSRVLSPDMPMARVTS